VDFLEVEPDVKNYKFTAASLSLNQVILAISPGLLFRRDSRSAGKDFLTRFKKRDLKTIN
jgi:hypothetical protein